MSAAYFRRDSGSGGGEGRGACVGVCGGYVGGSSPPAEGMISVLRRACMKRPEAIRVSSFVYVGGMVTAHCPQK